MTSWKTWLRGICWLLTISRCSGEWPKEGQVSKKDVPKPCWSWSPRLLSMLNQIKLIWFSSWHRRSVHQSQVWSFLKDCICLCSLTWKRMWVRTSALAEDSPRSATWHCSRISSWMKVMKRWIQMRWKSELIYRNKPWQFWWSWPTRQRCLRWRSKWLKKLSKSSFNQEMIRCWCG